MTQFQHKTEWGLFLFLSIIFIAIQSAHFSYTISDENTYVYMGKALTVGLDPYKDFFLAHPPVHIFYLGIIYLIFGLNITILKLSAVLPIVIGTGFLFKALLEKTSNIEAIGFAILTYTSYDILRFSTFATWTTLCVMLIMISLYFLIKKSYIAGAVTLSIASFTGIIAIIAAAGVLGYLILVDRKNFVKFISVFFGMLIALNLLMLPVFGAAYFEDVYRYHLQKPADIVNKGGVWLHLVQSNLLILIGAVLFLFSLKKTRHTYLLTCAVALSLMLVFSIINTFGYYFLTVLPLLALIASHGYADLYGRVSEDRKKQTGYLLMCVIIIAGILSSISFVKNHSQDFNEAQQISDYIKQNTPAQSKLFGDDSSTPLIALLSGRQIALNLIDSNNLRWRSSQLSVNSTIAQLDKENLVFVERRLDSTVGSLNYGPTYLDEFRTFIKKCTLQKTFNSTEIVSNGFRQVFNIYACEQS